VLIYVRSAGRGPHRRPLEQLRGVVGGVPVTVSVDLHGIMTARMLAHADALCPLHTYPHIDADDAGARAATLLLQLLDGKVAATTGAMRPFSCRPLLFIRDYP
jgi:microcystin degradation protein MlrC